MREIGTSTPKEPLAFQKFKIKRRIRWRWKKTKSRDEADQPNIRNDRNNNINAKDKLISKVSYAKGSPVHKHPAFTQGPGKGRTPKGEL